MPVRPPQAQTALTLAAVVFGVAWGLVLAIGHLDGRASWLDRIEAPLADLRFLLAGPRAAPRDVVIVAIDDRAVREAGAYPLPRPLLARLVRDLARRGAKAVALDILLVDPGSPEGDADLAAALKDAPAVIAAAAVFEREAAMPQSSGRFGATPLADGLVWPTERLRESAAIGLVNISTDASGTPRHVPLILRVGATIFAAFPLRAASIAAGVDPELGADGVAIAGRRSSTDLGYHLALRFYGPRGTVRTISAADVLRGDVSDALLAGRIVVVGATAIGTSDTFATPFDPVLPGVEVLATAVAHLVSGDGLVRSTATRRIDALAAVILPVLTILLIALRRIGVGLVLVVGLAAGWMAICAFAFGHGYWLQMTLPLAAVFPPAAAYVGSRLWLDQRTGRRLEATQQAFRRFHPPALADHLAASPDFLDRPVQQSAAVIFVDLSGFTGMSERLGPGGTRSVLKEFHSLIEAEVTERGGLVLSFMGDGAMIVFGLPAAAADDATRAVDCALSLARRVAEWLPRQPAGASLPLGVRVGAHYGPVVVSRLGADTHQHITATGDSVNVASRLLEVAAAHGAAAAVSEDLWRAAGRTEASSPGPAEAVDIRGREQGLQVRFWRPAAPA